MKFVAPLDKAFIGCMMVSILNFTSWNIYQLQSKAIYSSNIYWIKVSSGFGWLVIYLQIFIALPLLKSRPKPNLICSFVRFMFPLAIPWVPESGSIGRVWIYWKLYKYWALTLLRLFVIYEGNYFCKCGKCLILLLTKDGNQSSSI